MNKAFVKLIKDHALLAIAVLLLFGFAIFQLFGGAILADQTVKASSADHNLSGWAWSDMPNLSDEEKYPSNGTIGRGMGWISFNDTNHSGSENYGVNVKSNGDLEGYAWAENLGGPGGSYNGWISFEAGCPSGANPCQADFDKNSGVVSGWARALAYQDPQAGGWDGWISLSGIADNGSPYGVSVSGCNWSGWAWGGDILGWINFGPSGANDKPVVGVSNSDACTSAPIYSLTVVRTGTGAVDGLVTSDPSGIDCGSDCEETYTSVIPVSLTASVLIGTGSTFTGWSGDCDSAGNIIIDGIKTCTANFDLAAGAAPVCPSGPVFGVSPLIINRGDSATLSWGLAQNANSCQINPGNASVNCSGDIMSVSPSNTTPYELIISGPGGGPINCGPATLTVRPGGPPPPAGRRPWWREIFPW